MAARTKIHTSVGKITKTVTTTTRPVYTSGGYFSGAQLAKNVRAFISGIKKA